LGLLPEHNAEVGINRRQDALIATAPARPIARVGGAVDQDLLAPYR
jgi:hypothetical protein